MLATIWLPARAFAEYTADVTLTDSAWTDIGQEYPAGSTNIYMEVYDPDVSGSLELTFASNSDPAGEVVSVIAMMPWPV